MPAWRWGAAITLSAIFLPATDAEYVVISGPCTTTPSGDCVMSPGFPGTYAVNQECQISQTDAAQQIDVRTFNTEGCCDKLYVNGVGYSDITGPQDISPTGSITWTSDQSTVRPNGGWELCSTSGGGGTSGGSTPTSGGSTSGGDTSDDEDGAPIGVIIGCVVGGVVLLGCCGIIVFMLMSQSRGGRTRGAAAPPIVTSSAAAPPATVIPATKAEKEKEESNEAPHRSLGSLRTKLPEAMTVTPKYWVNKDLSKKFQEREHVSDDVETTIQKCVTATFRNVSTRDRKTEDMPKGFKVVSVQRNENSELWKKYITDRYAMGLKRSHKCTPLSTRGEILSAKELTSLDSELNDSVNETLMWHGTSPAAALAITREGFKLSRSGENAGSMYGKGLYFAECSSKSDEYAQDDAEGVHKGLYCLLLCRVVLGEQLVMTAGGSAGHKMIEEAIGSNLYDSVVGDRVAAVGTYREFVVYEDGLVYPEYLVIYRRLF